MISSVRRHVLILHTILMSMLFFLQYLSLASCAVQLQWKNYSQVLCYFMWTNGQKYNNLREELVKKGN